jgi:hypothetical protein
VRHVFGPRVHIYHFDGTDRGFGGSRITCGDRCHRPGVVDDGARHGNGLQQFGARASELGFGDRVLVGIRAGHAAPLEDHLDKAGVTGRDTLDNGTRPRVQLAAGARNALVLAEILCQAIVAGRDTLENRAGSPIFLAAGHRLAPVRGEILDQIAFTGRDVLRERTGSLAGKSAIHAEYRPAQTAILAEILIQAGIAGRNADKNLAGRLI